MALPKLNEQTKYDIKIPSTGKKIKFRPYLVKEEKQLLMAAESQDLSQIVNAMVDTIDACLIGKYDKDKLTTFDLEYLFTKIRSKSVGESTSIRFPCEECHTENEVRIVLDELEIDASEIKKQYKLTNEVSINLKFPSYHIITEYTQDDLDNASTLFNVAAQCIESIEFDDQLTLAEDCTKEELIEFMESMTTEQFKTIADFIQSIPKMSHDVTFDCVKCSHNNKTTLEGIQSFFT